MKRQRWTLALLGLLLLAGGLLMITGQAQISESERRQLAQWPQLTWQGLRSGSWTQHAERAATDQFPFVSSKIQKCRKCCVMGFSPSANSLTCSTPSTEPFSYCSNK